MWLTLSSSLMPMPPCSWTDSWLTWRAASAICDLGRGNHALAFRRVALGVDGRAGEARHRLDLLVADRHVDHAVLQRLERADRHAELLPCLEIARAWQRSRRRWRRRLRRTRARSRNPRPPRSAAAPRPRLPREHPAPTVTAASDTSAVRRPSRVRALRSVTPGARGSTTNRLMPSGSAPWPPVRADTTSRSAQGAVNDRVFFAVDHVAAARRARARRDVREVVAGAALRSARTRARAFPPSRRAGSTPFVQACRRERRTAPSSPSRGTARRRAPRRRPPSRDMHARAPPPKPP